MEYDHLYIQLELCETTLSSLFCRWIETGGEAGGGGGRGDGDGRRYGRRKRRGTREIG